MRIGGAILGAAVLAAAGVAVAAQPTADDWVQAILADHSADTSAGGAPATTETPAEPAKPRMRGLSISTSAYGAIAVLSDANKAQPAPADMSKIPPKAQVKPSSLIQFKDHATDLQVHFLKGSSMLAPESAAGLAQLATALQDSRLSGASLELAGHTDLSGRREANIILSQRRAESVKSFIVERGVDPKRVTAKGYGPDNLPHPEAPYDPRNRVVQARVVWR